jgi:integrase
MASDLLSAKTVENAKPKAKLYKLNDGRGLSLWVLPEGARYWRFRFRLYGKERLLSLGTFPDVSLEKARDRRDELRKQVADGIDPSDVRRAEKNAHKDVFSVLAKEWLEQQELAPRTLKKKLRVLKYLNAEIGNRPVSKITTALAYDVLRKISARGPDVGQMAYQTLNAVMFDAMTLAMVDRNPVTGLSKKLPSPKRQNHAAITDASQFGKLLVAIDHYSGQPVVRFALQFLALTFARPGEVRLASWDHVSIPDALWTIPAIETKQRREHLVPLAPQAIAILEAAKTVTFRPSKLLFPGLRPGRPLSDAAFNVALRSMGYAGDVQVAHGFRSTASTLLNEKLKFPMEVKELQLAHWRPGVWGVYDRAKLLDDRRKMMGKWADYLDELRKKANAKETD